ncbi:MAG: hypothetical protein H6993_18960 [Pseudomonadales bacterium]|nr:hypothetical protein [Pseudomonadales bacterium]MCP5186055.1 hypothetical protein [Pseudomonadales bacterium]
MDHRIQRLGRHLFWLLLPVACTQQYVPPADGRVSVIDLVMFPSAYEEKSVASYGYLTLDPTNGGGTLFFQKDHAARRGERFALPVQFTPDADRTRVERCNGQEVLMRGTLTRTATGHALVSGSDLVC